MSRTAASNYLEKIWKEAVVASSKYWVQPRKSSVKIAISQLRFKQSTLYYKYRALLLHHRAQPDCIISCSSAWLRMRRTVESCEEWSTDPLLTSVLDGDVWPVSSTGHLRGGGGECPQYHLDSGSRPEAGLDAKSTENSCPCWESKPGRRAHSPNELSWLPSLHALISIITNRNGESI
jgi:hypothetical protein